MKNAFAVTVLALSLLTACNKTAPSTPTETPTMSDVVATPPTPARIVRAGESNGNRFFTTETGEKLFQGAVYYNAHEFFHGYCVVSKKEGEQELYGVINAKGEVVVPITYPEYIADYEHGYFKVHKEKVGYVDSTGKMVIAMEYSNAKGIDDGLFILEKGRGKWGIVNAAGDVIVPFEYSKIDYFMEGLAPVQKGSKWGVIDRGGKLVIPASYESLTGFDKGVCLAQKGKKYGLIDKEGKPVTEFIYDEFKWEVESVKSEVSETGYTAIGQRFITEGGYIVVAKGKLWGAIDAQGAEIIPFEFDYVGGKDASGVNVGNGKRRGVWNLDTKAVKWFGE